MNIVGLDGGMLRLGVGAVRVSGGEVELLTFGLIHNPRDDNQKWNEYLAEGVERISMEFPKLINMTRPHLIVSETIPPGRLGSNSELVVAAVVVCRVIAFQFGIEWKNVGAKKVKETVTGDDKATKAKVKNAMLEMFPTVQRRHIQLKAEQKEVGVKAVGLPQDVFDALAVSVTGVEIYGNKAMQEVQEGASINAILAAEGREQGEE
jgi:Holliday junction resolvasome RuvABC endonuclease subunit